MKVRSELLYVQSLPLQGFVFVSMLINRYKLLKIFYCVWKEKHATGPETILLQNTSNKNQPLGETSVY